MTVYLLECGEYSQRGVVGVYATPEAAMAEYPNGTWVESEPYEGMRRWYNEHGDTWAVDEYEVKGS